MIDTRDVIRMLVPYPSMDARLATDPHMYICVETEGTKCSFVKCQSLKPYMILNPEFKHYVDEDPNIKRNPFRRTTRVDCDKKFGTQQVEFNDRMKTTSRPDICPELYEAVMRELEEDGYESIVLKDAEVVSLNWLTSYTAADSQAEESK